MKTKKYILIVICAFLLFSSVFAICHGRKSTYYIKFDGKISSIDDSSLEIQGYPQNDAGHRDQYMIEKNDDISIYNTHGSKTNFSSLAVGDHVEILYMDQIVRSKLEEYGLDEGAVIPNVQQISVIE